MSVNKKDMNKAKKTTTKVIDKELDQVNTAIKEVVVKKEDKKSSSVDSQPEVKVEEKKDELSEFYSKSLKMIESYASYCDQQIADKKKIERKFIAIKKFNCTLAHFNASRQIVLGISGRYYSKYKDIIEQLESLSEFTGAELSESFNKSKFIESFFKALNYANSNRKTSGAKTHTKKERVIENLD